MKCGNMHTKAQMEALSGNIKTFRKIEKDFGSVDSFLASEQADQIVKRLSEKASPYKLRLMGDALVWEYLRNVGIDGAKPDTHLRRFLGSGRMGSSRKDVATVQEVYEQVEQLSRQTGMPKVQIDSLIWSFCADGYGEICTAVPHCEKCPIREWCKKG